MDLHGVRTAGADDDLGFDQSVVGKKLLYSPRLLCVSTMKLVARRVLAVGTAVNQLRHPAATRRRVVRRRRPDGRSRDLN